MGRFDNIKTAIDTNINTNGNQAITGAVMNSVMKQTVDSVDTQLTELESEISKNKIETTRSGGYIITNVGIGNVVNLTPTINYGDYRYMIQECKEGDIVYVFGHGGNNPRLWAFLDSNNVLLSVAEDGEYHFETPIRLVAPQGSAKVIINDDRNREQFIISGYAAKEADNANVVNAEQDEKISAINASLEKQSIPTYKEDFYINLNVGIGNIVDLTPVYNSLGFRCMIQECKEGDVFHVYGHGGTSPRLYGLLDSNNVLIEVAEDGEYHFVDYKRIVIPSGVTKVILNDDRGYQSYIFTSDILKDTERALYENLLQDEELKSLNERVGKRSHLVTIPQVTSDTIFQFATNIEGDGVKTKYSMELPLKKSFDIRFKFRLIDNIINEEKTAYIFESFRNALGGRIMAKGVPLTQITQQFDDNGVTKTSYFPCYNGGISLLNAGTSGNTLLRGTERVAFSIQYVGNAASASFENNGSQIIIKEGGNEVRSITLASYSNMEELYAAIKNTPNFEFYAISLEWQSPMDLAKTPETQLVSEYKGNINGKNESEGGVVVYKDAAPLYVPYAIDMTWHQVEVASIDGKIYKSVDGYTSVIDDSVERAETTRIILGNTDIAIEFKDLEISVDNPSDAEVVGFMGDSGQPLLISSVLPYYAIYEGHQIYDTPTSEVGTDAFSAMGTTVERLQIVFDKLREKGYVPITLHDLLYALNNRLPLPKRSFTLMFDDYQFDNFLNLKKRAAFTRNSVYANLAVVTDAPDKEITYNGKVISMEKAVQIANKCGFEVYSHTRNHRIVKAIKPSEMYNESVQDIYSADENGVNPSVIIYPEGQVLPYNRIVFRAVGYEGGICIAGTSANYNSGYLQDPYCLWRIEIGARRSTEEVLKDII